MIGDNCSIFSFLRMALKLKKVVQPVGWGHKTFFTQHWGRGQLFNQQKLDVPVKRNWEGFSDAGYKQ